MFAALMLPFGSSAVATTSDTPPPPLDASLNSRTLDLRTVGSQIVVETIEDAIRQGGLALLGEGFQLDSSLSWVFGETIQGEVDTVVPLWSRDGHIVFAQLGAVFWTGLEEEERTDGNLGVVYRTEMANDVIGGASLFYDYDFQIGHSRLGIGIDAQRDGFYGAFNYYHPLSDTQDGREGYVEDALRGMDARLAVESDVTRFGGNVGYWKFQGDEEVKDDWKLSYGIDAGLRIIPGVFLEGSLQHHDKDVSLGQRASVGLAFKFSLPDFKGKSYGNGGGASNLYKIVEREKRILYEEREANSPVQLTPVDGNGQPLSAASTIEEGGTVTIAGELEALPDPVMLELVIDEDASSADLGTDFSYGHEVYVLDEATGQQSAPGTVTDCPEVTCEMMIPAGVTRFDVEIEILTDNTAKEVPEEIVLQVNVPEEHQRMVRSGETRVTIQAHGNEIGFATDAVATLAENNERTGVEVQVSIDEPSPAPITLNVATSGTATVNEDYRIDTTTLIIPANASSASLTLWGINNDRGEGSKSIVLTLSGNLPEGWTITDDEHTVTLQDDDLSIFFTDATTSSVDEPGTGSNANVTVAVGITQAPTANITVRVAAGGTGETATPGSSMDYTFPGMNFTFPADSTAPQTATFSVHPDNVAEEEEFIVLTIADDTTTNSSREREGSGFSLGSPHTITIPANDNTVGFVSGTADTLGEDGGTANVEVSISNPAPVDITLNVSVDTATSTATEGTDFTLSPSTLTISRGDTTGTITLTGIDDRLSEGSKDIDLTLSVVGNLPDGWAEGDLEHKVTLQDDDLSIGFARGSGTIDEPASDTNHEIDIEITQAPTAAITLQISKASSSTADTTGSNIDVTFSPTTVTFMPGSSAATKHTVTLNVKADTVAEGAEFIELELGDSGNTRTSNGNMFSFGRQKYRLNINASDNTVGFASGAADTLGEDGGTANVDVSISNPAPVDITLNVSVDRATSTATEGTDFTLSPSTLTISRGDTTGTITLTGIDDRLSEGSKDIDLTLSVVGNLPDGWAEGDLEHRVILQDDDLSIGFARGSGTIDEPASDTNHEIDIEITQAPTAAITLQISEASSSTADTTGSNIDVTFSPTTVTFMPGPSADTKHTVTLNVKADTVAEGAEFIELELGDSGNTRTSNGNMFSFGRQKYRLNINASDNTVGFVSGAAETLGEDGGTANVEVSISNPAPEDITLNVSVDVATSTATQGTDFTLSPSTLTISQGQTTGAITLTGINNQSGDGNKHIDLVLSVVGNLPDGWAEGDLEHEVTLQDDDLIVYFVTGDGATPSSEEEPTSDKSVTIEVGITQAPSAEIKVMLAADTSASSAERGTGKDYTFTDIELTFPAGGTASQTATLMLLHDTVPENDETIVLTLTEVGGSLTAGGNNFSLGGNHTITIPANDQININFATGSSRAEGDAQAGHPTINLSRAFSSDLVVNVAVSDDSTAVAGEDYTDNIPSSVTIMANNTGWFIEIDVLDDDKDEDTETIIIEISIPSAGWPEGINLGQKRHVFSILDNDVPANTIGFRSGDTVAVEGVGAFNQRSATFTLEIAKDLPSTVDITVTVSGVSDASGFTFFNIVPMMGPTQLSSNVLSIGSGVTEYDFIMGIPEDDNTTDENITLTLSSSNLPSGWSFGSTRSPSTWMLNVEDND